MKVPPLLVMEADAAVYVSAVAMVTDGSLTRTLEMVLEFTLGQYGPWGGS